MSYLLMLLWIISMAPMIILPYSIALFYQRSFKRSTYPILFLIAFLFYIASSVQYPNSSLYLKDLFFAIGGVTLGGASIRLHNVMTRRRK